MSAGPAISQEMPAPTAALRPGPLLRGWLHMVCFFLSLPAGLLVVAAAWPGRPRAGAFVYALAMSALFGVSGSYHRGRWSPEGRARMKRLDHATIFVMIAGTYTPLCLVAFSGAASGWLLVAVWLAAGVGVVLAGSGVLAQGPSSIGRHRARRGLGLACYMAFGWAGVATLPALAGRVGATELALLVIGGVVYTMGGIVLGARRPDPWPQVFGYHEVWHVMVVAAAVCHFVAVATLVGGRA